MSEETIQREVASAWAIKLWERLQDVLKNEEAWALLEESQSELAIDLAKKLQQKSDELVQAHETIRRLRNALDVRG